MAKTTKTKNATTQIGIKLLEGAKKPKKEFESSSGYDCYAYIKDANGNPSQMTINTGRGIIPLGFKIDLPKGLRAFMMNRSGMAAKGLKGYSHRDSNNQERYNSAAIDLGLIDCNYRGQCGAIYYNNNVPFIIKDGDEIGQMFFSYEPDVEVVEVEELSEAYERGEQGFNS